MFQTKQKIKETQGVPMCTQIHMWVQLDASSIGFSVTAKPVLRGHSNIDKNPILMTNDSLSNNRS